VKDYVLGFETSFMTMGDKGPEVIKNMVDQQFPFPVFIVHLKTKPYNKFKKQIKHLKIAPFYTQGD
jgi:5,10-methenyltetrahydromethanopterin hydrogenase